MSERVDALRAALEAAPGDSVLRVMLAEALAAEGRRAEALEEYELVSGTGDLGGPAALAAAELALDLGRFETAGRLLDVALEAGEIEGAAELQRRLGGRAGSGGLEDPCPGEETTLPQLDDHERIDFAAVGGLDDVKKAVTRLIILPYQRPELYLTYGRGSGGGVLMSDRPGAGRRWSPARRPASAGSRSSTYGSSASSTRTSE